MNKTPPTPTLPARAPARGEFKFASPSYFALLLALLPPATFSLSSSSSSFSYLLLLLQLQVFRLCERERLGRSCPSLCLSSAQKYDF